MSEEIDVILYPFDANSFVRDVNLVNLNFVKMLSYQLSLFIVC